MAAAWDHDLLWSPPPRAAARPTITLATLLAVAALGLQPADSQARTGAIDDSEAGLVVVENTAGDTTGPRPAPKYALTIYGGADAQALFGGPVELEPVPGHAIVHEQRSVEVGSGAGTLTLQGFPHYLDAGALTTALSGGQVLSQRFDAEPLRGDTLLHRNLGRQVTVEQYLGGEINVVSGELLSAELPLSLRLADGSVISINDYSRIRMPAPATPYSAVPQLRLGVESAQAGRQALTLIYATSGLAWRPEYVVRLRPDVGCRLDFAAHARIVNRSGHSFTDATLKLIAGEPWQSAPLTATAADATGTAGAQPDGYSYSFASTLSLPDGSSQQITLLPGQRELACRRELLYAASSAPGGSQRVPQTRPGHDGASRAVTRSVSFHLADDTALPPGRARILAEDGANGTIEFLAEQALPAHPPGRRLDVGIGIAAGITGERQMLALDLDPDELGLTERIRIRLDNSTGEAAQVRVREHLWRWRQWRIVDSSHDHQPFDAASIDFPVQVPGNGSATVDYGVHYRWTRDLR